MLTIKCLRSKKGNIYYCLTLNDVTITFDVPIISRATKIPIRDIYLLEEGKIIEINN